MQVWLTFATASTATPELAPVYAHGHTDVREPCRSALRSLDVRRDIEGEAARLHVLLDGLAMHLGDLTSLPAIWTPCCCTQATDFLRSEVDPEC